MYEEVQGQMFLSVQCDISSEVNIFATLYCYLSNTDCAKEQKASVVKGSDHRTLH
jgi:hypothetical protein